MRKKKGDDVIRTDLVKGVKGLPVRGPGGNDARVRADLIASHCSRSSVRGHESHPSWGDPVVAKHGGSRGDNLDKKSSVFTKEYSRLPLIWHSRVDTLDGSAPLWRITF